MNVTIPPPGRRLPPPESNEGYTEPEKETTIEASGGENQTSIVTSETSEGANATVTQGETTSQNETQIETTITSSTTEIGVLTTPTAEDQTETYTYLPLPEIADPQLIAQLRAQQGLAAYPRNLPPVKPPNYDYYGELHDEIPPNVRGPEYPGLSLDIPVILKETDNKTEEKKPPAVPGWQLQFPDRPPKSDKLADGTPKLEKTTFKVNYPDYFNVVNDGIKVEPLPDDGTGRFQPDYSSEVKNSEKSTVSGVNLRSMDYPGLHDIHTVPDSIENVLGTYSPVPFKFDEKAAEKELMALFSKSGPDRMMKLPPTLKAVKALSPTYTVPHIETIETTGTPIIGSTTTTTFITEPTTTIRITTEPTTTTTFTTESTTTTSVTSTTEPTTTTSVTSTTEPTTTISVTSTTQPSPTTNYDDAIGTTLDAARPLPHYIQTYEVDWNAFSTMRSTFTFTKENTPTTTAHPLIENMKNEMAMKQVGYFSVCMQKFFEIFAKKESTALKALLKGGSIAMEKMNKHNDLVGLGRPMWPGTELAFLQMRLTPIETVKSRAGIIYMFYASGTAFDVKRLHESIDNLFFKREGEKLMQAVTEFQDYPGKNHDMNATNVMEHLFKALLAPYFRDRHSPKLVSVLKDINDKLRIARDRFFSNSRRNTRGESIYISTIDYNLINKEANIESNSDRSIVYDSDDNDDTSEIPMDNFGGKETNNAVEYKNEKVRHRNVESKVRLLKNASDETSGQIGHHKETEMSLSVKHKVTEATILYHHDKYSNKNPELYFKSYKNAKKLFKSSESDHDNELLKDNKQKNTYHTNGATSGEPNDKKWYLEIIKYNKSEPKSYHEADNKFDNINSKDKINTKTIEYHNEAEIDYSMKHKVPEITKFYHHVKYGNKEQNKYPKSYKKSTKSSIKYVEGELSKDIKVNTNYKYYARNGEPSEKKWYLEIFKYNKSEPKTNDEKINKIGYGPLINSRDKTNGITAQRIRSGTYEAGPMFQRNGIKSQIISTTIATVKNNDFSHKTTKKIYDYETYDDETESKVNDKKENKVSINGKSGLSNNKDDDYDTFDDSKDSKEINHSNNTNIHRKQEPNNENRKGKASWKKVKAKDYIKELRIGRTTKEKEYFRDIKQYYTTTISYHGETFQNKKIDKKYLRSQNDKIWSNSEKVHPTQTNTTIATENEVLRYENKKVLKDKENIKIFATRAPENIQNDNSEDDIVSFENELKNKDQETNLKQHYNQFNAQESETIVEDTNILLKRYTRLSQRAPQKRFKKKQRPEVENNEKHKYYSQSPKPQDVYNQAPDFKQKDLGLKNKKANILKKTENNKTKSSDYENNKNIWPHSRSQYIINDAAYLKERFRDFNRDNVKTKKGYRLRNLGKNENILRVESSYSDEEEVLKSNLQDNLLHGGRNFTDTLHKYKKNNPIRDISSYSDEEDILKKNIYKLFA